MYLRPILSSIFICMSTQAFAEHDDQGSHQAHIHGEAEMTIILQGKELAINFQSPSANIVGFEHQPETDQQSDAIDAALSTLLNPSDWLQFNGGDCNLESLTADTNLKSNHQHEEHSDHGDEEHSDHGDENHSGHEGEEHSDHKDEVHTEFSSQYLYTCQTGSNLEAISITLQSIYPAIEHIESQWIINGKQGATEIEANDNQILFK